MTGGDQDAADAFTRAVGAEVSRARVREAAAHVLRQEHASGADERGPVLLSDFLAVPDDPVTYRIGGLLPVGGRAVLAARMKVGKSTMLDNLLRSLADGGEFLERFPVHRPTGRVVLIDDELDERMLRRWLREHAIVDDDRVAVLSLRGWVGTFNLLDPDCRARWAAKLRAVEAGFVILDCLRPVLDALGLSEDKEAGRFLVAFDALLAESGVSEAVLSHHAGHTGERSRGDSRIRDWPDVEWKLVREATEGGEDDPAARRYFSAYGRDVDVREGLLEYDARTRRLRLTGGTRRETASDGVIPDLLAYLVDNPGTSKAGMEAPMKDLHEHSQNKVRGAIKIAIDRLDITIRTGPRNADLLYVNPLRLSSSVRHEPVNELGSVSSLVRYEPVNEVDSCSSVRSIELTRSERPDGVPVRYAPLPSDGALW